MFNDYYIRNVNVHSHVTHQQNKLHTYKCRALVAQTFIRFYGDILWNELSNKTCCDTSFACNKQVTSSLFLWSSLVEDTTELPGRR